jgi:hypothetical protein
MSEPKPRQWFQARLRWAVLEEGRGLDHWREAEHIFLSENRETAFQEALRIGEAEEHSLFPTQEQKGAPVIDCRFAEVVYLEERGMGRTAFEVYLGEKKATERIAFDHEFDPAGRMPAEIF